MRTPGESYSERIGVRYAYEAKEEAYTRAKPGELRGIEFVFVKGGKFLMGSPGDEAWRSRSEGPRHEAAVSDFWMSKHEVSWDLVYDWLFSHSDVALRSAEDMAEGDRAALPPPHPRLIERDPDYNKWHNPRRPATGLTQYAAQEFCRWLTARTGRLYRLPTEAEWEYAARAGAQTLWHFGEDKSLLKDFAWYGEDLASGSREVGLKKPNALGLHDVYGNAAEWTLDGWSDNYEKRPAGADPWVPRPEGSRYGVVRGGDWTSPWRHTRSAARRKQDDTGSVENSMADGIWFDTYDHPGRKVGFRLVSPVKPQDDGRHQSIKPFAKRSP